ncbi:sigma-70 family RNA polymerase sigma factor [Candidatus Poribacteria bacterium]|nr:sigma-70 family RNA polymerase sigma factor [Candidatus Poribacteria bacterium]MBT5533255.1 sigma-70 family RNA polymerase sigma factor [Candidatus Poribacteria bacterium]MBT5710177.1 sigma-70 family RNA polymerase sigma factor [Candidatus Poribacteria bacterium]MBT7096454.1 sigma-70 family RNA polymerase sigma factor [Candidatus Poribacteria bacterium]MBT7807606.1 sigma-70 family RNA polymerase sigma factor [Candidatus Poribacteria bacterium]
MDDRADAFHQLVLAHVGLIRRIGASRLRRRRNLDDYVQSVLVAVYASRGRVQYMDHLDRWIAGVARNVARKWNRKREPAFTADLPEIPLPVPPIDEVLSDRERWKRVVDALAALSPRERELLRSYYLEERSAKELEKRLGISQGAIYVRLTRARQALRRRLGVVSGLLAWFYARPKARAFGQVPVGGDRMSAAFSLMTSALIVGWLGASEHHIEQTAANLATIPAHDGTRVRVVPVRQVVAESRANAAPIASASVSEGQSVSKVLDIELTRNWSPVVGALHTMLQGAGQLEWSPARLQGVLGHAFSFVMREGAGTVWQEAYMDYGATGKSFETLPEIGYRIQRFQAVQANEEGDFTALKADAWEAVRASIDRGVPAAAWNPMSMAQKEEGLTAFTWGVLTGYDESTGTYTVRHPGVSAGSEAFSVRYDAIGHIGDDAWFCVLVYDGPAPVNVTGTHAKALQNAVALADGTRFERQDLSYRVDAHGFAAIELWREAIESGVATPGHSQYHAGELRGFRGHAAAYLRELVDVFPAAAADLTAGAEHYDRLIETSTTLHDLCGAAKDAGGFSDEARAEARDLVTAALQSDRAAITSIEAALAVLDESH